MADKSGWVTSQFRIRRSTHEWLKAQADKAGISQTAAAGVLLDYAASHGWALGRVEIVRQPSAVVTMTEQPDGS
jgi:hypothetical protein